MSNKIINDILKVSEKINKVKNKTNKNKIKTSVISSPFKQKPKKLENIVIDFFNKDYYKLLKADDNSTKFGKRLDNLKTSLGQGLGSVGQGLGSLKTSVGEGMDIVGEGLGRLKTKIKDSIKNKTKAHKNIILHINKIKKITKLVKNDLIYIDITNLIKGYELYGNEDEYFKEDPLLNMILYISLSNNNSNKNKIIYFIRKGENNINKLYVYDVNKDEQYKPIELQ